MKDERRFAIYFDMEYLSEEDLIFMNTPAKQYVVYKQHWANGIKRFFRFLPIKFRYIYYIK